MTQKDKIKKKSGFRLKEWLVPILTSLAIFLLALTPVFKNLDLSVYDLYLSLIPSLEQDDNIVIVDIDDNAIDNLGGWPWPRTYMAYGIQLLSEFGAQSVVLDIEYNTHSQPGINRTYLEKTLKRDFDSQFQDLSAYIADLYTAMLSGQIPLEYAADAVNDLLNATNMTKDDLYASSEAVAIDSDAYLAQSIGFSGITGVAYRLINDVNENLSDEEKADLINKISFNATGVAANSDRYSEMSTSLYAMQMAGKWDGYVNVEIDADGKRRRVKPIETINGKNYGQLVFEALLARLGNPEVKVSPTKIELIGALYPDGEHDVTIPLDSDGDMLVHWPHTEYAESFRHTSFYYLINYKNQIDELYDFLSDLSLRDAWMMLRSDNPVEYLIKQKDMLNTILEEELANPTEEGRKAYFLAEKEWIQSVSDFIDKGYDTALGEAISQYANVLDESNPDSKGQKDLWLAEKKGFLQVFAKLNASFHSIEENREMLEKNFDGAMCIIGYTGTGTSDLGAQPFQKSYPNTGIHACAVNTILQRDFLQEVPNWVAYILLVLISFFMFFVVRRRTAVSQNAVSIIFIVVLFLAPFILFLVTGIYIKPANAIIAGIVTYIGYVVVRFLSEAKEKSFLRKAFGVYIADEVIDQLVDDPEKLKLGGENREMTAMFTDIQKFSTVSEQITATQLVQLLNEYLTGMSDIILDEKGVVDKYEGDAIIAFWGAPMPLSNHADHALSAALKMHKIEKELNKHFLETKISPTPLLTRIGINTGDMVAGNMGTERKMNYTIMGNTVNLAARLEGVNKMYGTWILTTNFTAKGNKDRFVFRRLDRVRVVGIQMPVQLLELVEERSLISPEKNKFLTDFDQALDYFEKRDWKNAGKGFKHLSEQDPIDGPSKVYLKRCLEYRSKPPKEDWDGVFNMTQK